MLKRILLCTCCLILLLQCAPVCAEDAEQDDPVAALQEYGDIMCEFDINGEVDAFFGGLYHPWFWRILADNAGLTVDEMLEKIAQIPKENFKLDPPVTCEVTQPALKPCFPTIVEMFAWFDYYIDACGEFRLDSVAESGRVDADSMFPAVQIDGQWYVSMPGVPADIKYGKDNNEAFEKIARRYHENGRFIEALPLYIVMASADPENQALLVDIGLMSLEIARTRGAESLATLSTANIAEGMPLEVFNIGNHIAAAWNAVEQLEKTGQPDNRSAALDHFNLAVKHFQTFVKDGAEVPGYDDLMAQLQAEINALGGD